jgi:hypothetical protein
MTTAVRTGTRAHPCVREGLAVGMSRPHGGERRQGAALVSFPRSLPSGFSSFRRLRADLDSANTTWAPLVFRFAAALLLFAAALLPDRSTKQGTHLSWHALASIVLLVGVGLVVEVLATELPTAVATRVPPEASGVVSFEAHPVVLGVQGGTLLCSAVAASTFTRQAGRTGDNVAGRIGAACAVGAWARVNYLLMPPSAGGSRGSSTTARSRRSASSGPRCVRSRGRWPTTSSQLQNVR